ncbi:hypothetical protein Salat_0671700 [Sesamum alatum]|uniref:Uncharacterized protein n=1 Tax=Sesamum alatum TaxID=300844 RepID=A0AAE1YRT6_9LAMI|nr:hypothetical protein Salat_0671700 [Sesamum alatum]
MSVNMNVDPEMNSSSATKRSKSSSRKRRLDDPLAELPKLVSMVSTFCETANTRAEKLCRVLGSEFGDPDQCGTVLDATRQLHNFDENEQFVIAQRLVNRPKDLELFYSLTGESHDRWVRLMLDVRF